MVDQPIRDLAADGSLRSKGSKSAGPADQYLSQDAIDAGGIIHQTGNQSTIVHRVHGDGRKFMPIHLSTPAAFTPGQYWLEKVGADTFFVFVNDAGAAVYVSTGGGGGSVPTPTEVPLTSGFPTLLATVVVDSISVIEWGLVLRKIAQPQRHHFRLVGAHDGTSVADAGNTQLSQQGTISFGVLDVTLSLSLSGAGAGQAMELRATASSTDWIASIVPERMVAPQ